MRPTMRCAILLSCVFTLSAGLALAEQASTQPAPDAANAAAMEAMQRLGSPSEGHKTLEPLAGNWNYTLQWWMSPEAPPQAMSGTSANHLILGGRFLQQEVHGAATAEQPPFDGLGFIGYDNIRQEYQTTWFDNMATGMMVGTGQFDAAGQTFTERSDFSCPMTGEAHRQSRSVLKIVDANHHTYESYMRTPDGTEFKAMEIRYTRAQ